MWDNCHETGGLTSYLKIRMKMAENKYSLWALVKKYYQKEHRRTYHIDPARS